MARKIKNIISDGVDKREVGYYSTPGFVARYLAAEMMNLNPSGVSVLDPAIGKGELIEAFAEAGKIIHGYDIIDYSERPVGILFYHEDFLQSYINNKEGLRQNTYDYIIMNPPFNCHEHSYIATNRQILHEHFEVGIYNMYALFLDASIEIAKDGCIIGVIVPDSVLFTPAYNKLRAKIIQECEILQVILCPEDLFRQQGANVSTCILVLRKGICSTNNSVLISNRTTDIENFRSMLKRRLFDEVCFHDIYLQNDNSLGGFVFDCPHELLSLFSDCPRLGNVFECGGGVSTGTDTRFTSHECKDGFTVPFYPNVCSRFIVSPGTFLCDDYQEQSEGRRNFIIRHRNMLNHEGIVCSGIGKRFYAAYLPEVGVTGVNAAIWPCKKDIFWLLSYLNSSLVTYLLKGVIARSNMTTIGNVSSLPIISFSSSEKHSLGRIAKNVIIGKMSAEEAVTKIDRIIYRTLNLPVRIRRKISRFCADIPHLV